MKKHVSILITMLSFLLLPNITYADCTKEEIEHFKEIEDEYKITYKYNKETNDYILTMHQSISKDFTFLIDADLKMNISIEEGCIKEENGNIVCKTVQPGKYKMIIIGNTEKCQEMIKSIEVNIPRHNKLSDDPLCEGLEEFVLCDPEYDKEINYEDFVSRINTYKNSRKEKEKQAENKKNNSDNIIINYIINNYQIILIVVTAAIAIVLIIILMAKNLKQSRRLE